MSNIYVHEPPTDGKVLLKTTVGDIEVELWSKEAPKACRNFVQLCMEGYYDGTIFHRLIKDFIVQGGDPDGDGSSVGESIYGKPFNDEFHSRLRFVRRGLVAMANSGKNDNTSHFFFTLGACTELSNKNTIFGRVGGDTIYNMLKLGESETDANDRPLYPQKINRIKVISNPFDDIIPRVTKGKVKEDKEESSKVKAKAVKNFSLLSFGDEAREEEEEVIKATEKMQNKSKSSHDLLNDKNLSSIPAVRIEEEEEKEEEDDEEEEMAVKKKVDSIREKLKRKTEADDNKKNKKSKTSSSKGHDDDDDAEEFTEFKLSNTSEERIKKYKKEAKQLLRELKDGQKEAKPQEDEKKSSKPHKLERNLDLFKGRQASNHHSGQKDKQKDREKDKQKDKDNDTMDILTRFKKKIQAASRLTEYDSGDEDAKEDEEKEEDDEETNKDISWMAHKLVCPVDGGKVLDANIADLERYEIYDPRNPITQRRKKESANKMKNVKQQD